MYVFRSILGLLLLNIINLKEISCEECVATEKNEQVSEDTRLREDLLCNYNKHFVPLRNDTEEMKMSVKMNVANYGLHEYENIKIMYTENEMTLKWQDAFLTWDPKDYNSISEIVMSTDEIWSPEIMPEVMDFFSRSDALLSSTSCKVSSSGLVTCDVDSSHGGFCEGDDTFWPYDIYECNLQYMVLTYSSEIVTIDFPNVENDTFIIEDAASLEWVILAKESGYYSHKPERGVLISEMYFDFRLKRNIGNRIPFLFLNMIVLTLMSLMCFWSNFESTDRVILCLINIICHIWELQNLEWQINMKLGHTVPIIVCYYKDSLVLAFFILVETMVFKKILESEKPTPNWLISIDRILGRKIIRKILFVEGNNSPEQRNEEQGSFEQELQFIKQSNQMEKKGIIQILDRLCFTGFLLGYFIMGINILTLK